MTGLPLLTFIIPPDEKSLQVFEWTAKAALIFFTGKVSDNYSPSGGEMPNELPRHGDE